MRKLTPLLVALAVLGCTTSRPARNAPSRPTPARPFISAPAGETTGAPVDQDGDGRADAWVTREADGSVSRLAYDLDRDGAPDVVLAFEGGALVRKEVARRVEGVPPTWSVFERGELVRKERDTDGDGKADLWERYANGFLVAVERDTDRDGAPDRSEPRSVAPPSVPQK